MLLSDFNYYFNKAVHQYINKRYNIYDINQQVSDDLRVLKATTILPVNEDNLAYKELAALGAGKSKLFSGTFEVNLPDDYLHILNCICIYHLDKDYKCWNKNDNVQFSAKRLTSDSWSTIVNDWYNRPLPERPYYYIHHVNTNTELPTNLYKYDTKTGTDQVTPEFDKGYITLVAKDSDGNSLKTLTAKVSKKIGQEAGYCEFVLTGAPLCYTYRTAPTKGSPFGDLCYLRNSDTISINFVDGAIRFLIDEIHLENDKVISDVNYEYPRVISLQKLNSQQKVSLVDKPAYLRHNNSTKVRCEIRYGNDTSVFKLQYVLIDYIKSPQFIRLTQEQMDLTEDTSQIMEFPDNVCHEIINELVLLVMENNQDPRLQTHSIVTQSIANPVQQQTPPNKATN